MQIDIKGRNVPVTDELRTHAERRLDKVARQVSDLAQPGDRDVQGAKPARRGPRGRRGDALSEGRDAARARRLAARCGHSLNLVVDELARQVKRHRDKLRHRREAHAAVARRAASAPARGVWLPSL